MMEVMITTTLKRIQEHSPSPYGWTKLLNGLGKTEPDNEPLPFATILEINGLDDALWCCRVEPQYAKEWRLFAVTCARRVEHLNPDPRVKNAIDAAERYAHGNATDAELNAAREAVRTALEAAMEAARTAWEAAREAAREATRDPEWAVWDPEWAAAWAATGAAAGAATGAATDAATDAARGAAMGAAMEGALAAWTAEREWQKQEFLRVITETER